MAELPGDGCEVHSASELNAASHVNPNTQKIRWAGEFLRADGKYETTMFLSKEDCEAGLANAMNKTQSPPATQGHCIYLGDNSPFIRSQVPAGPGSNSTMRWMLNKANWSDFRVTVLPREQ